MDTQVEFKARSKKSGLEQLTRERIVLRTETCQLGPVVDGKRTHLSCNTPHGPAISVDNREKPPLPTRVIDLGTDGDSPRLYVPLLEHGLVIYADYVILRHCWGEGNASACTAKDNFHQRRRGFDMSLFPQAIPGAVAVTRALGQRYLFADAICIIQHKQGQNPTDWMQEAPRMGQYYQNALCTLAAAVASDSRGGFLVERLAEKYPVDPVSLGPWSDSSLVDQEPLEIFLQPIMPLWVNYVDFAPLYTRGWTLQERALSNRVVHFSRNAVYWECSEVQASEFLPAGLGRSFGSAFTIPANLSLFMKSLASSTVSKFGARKQQLCGNWFRLMCINSRSSLIRQLRESLTSRTL